MCSVDKKIFFGDFVFEVCENVFEPAEDSFLFAKNLFVNDNERVLDMGTGSGILGVVAAKRAREVVSIDVNPFAIRCAKKNAQRNCAQSNMTFIRGDLFRSLKEITKFDLILFNSPYLPSEQSEGASWLDRAWVGGTTGRDVIDFFIFQAPKYLAQSGRILMVQSSLSNVEETIRKFEDQQLKTKIKATLEAGFFEKIVLIEAIA
jgi:release factor glutamine methyltransferase